MGLSIQAQEKSVAPEINKAFRKPDIADFQGKFEKEGREAFEHREAIVKACQIREGMQVADVGAGTGLFSRLGIAFKLRISHFKLHPRNPTWQSVKRLAAIVVHRSESKNCN